MINETERRMGSRRKDLMSPCKGCGLHTPGCHSGCDGYAEFREKLKAVREYQKEHRYEVETVYRDCRKTEMEKTASRKARLK